MFFPNFQFILDHNFFVYRSVIEGLLEALPTMFAETNVAEPVLGAAVKAVYAALVCIIIFNEIWVTIYISYIT